MDEGRQNLHWLTNEFLGYLRRQEGIPYTKGELAREQILRYLVERYDGDLEAEQDIFATRRRPPKKRRPQATGDPGLLFCPDHDTLDRFLVGLLGFPNPQYYKTAAMFELVPAWLRFLEGLDLIDPEWCEGAILELRGLATDLRKIWEEHTSDPTLMQALTERWGSAAVG